MFQMLLFTIHIKEVSILSKETGALDNQGWLHNCRVWG